VSTKWQVKRADWGAADRRIDVTARLWQVLYSDANSEIPVDSVTMGFDSAVGPEKTLRVFAENDAHEKKTLTYKDGDVINPQEFETGATSGKLGFPPPYKPPHFGTLYVTEQRPAPSPPLEIIAAYYGWDDEYNDVTCLLQKMVANGRLVVDVTNDSMGGDPAIGATKVLSVVFRVDGEPERSTTVVEGETLRIPTGATSQNQAPPASPTGEKTKGR
jgi:hypothetical protein